MRQALRLVTEASRAAPGDPRVLELRGRALELVGCSREAAEAYACAETAGGASSDLYRRLAWSCHADGATETALQWMHKAVGADPSSAAAHAGLGMVQYLLGRHEEAERSLRQALDLSPDDFATQTYLGHCLLSRGRSAEAEAVFARAAEREPLHAGAWSNLGVARIAQRREADARIPFEKAIDLESSLRTGTSTFVNLGNVFRDLGRFDDALDVFERHLPQCPDPYALLSYALLLLLVGRFREGWAAFEARWLNEPLCSRSTRLSVPSWRGQDVRGKTVLLRYEQGVGDMIQFLRYAPGVQARGSRTVLSVPYELVALAECFDGIDQVLRPDEPLPAVDYQIDLLSLPLVFQTDLTSIPGSSRYLRVPPARLAQWAARLPAGNEHKVGLVWAGNPKHANDTYRSASPAVLSPILQTSGVQFFSLQKGDAEAQIATLAPGVARLGAEIEDWLDTAAVVSQLDLVICVDTAVAHLAGALGKPVWLMLPSPPDWRWLLERSDSPWYPTMRLFRQSIRGDWKGVARSVADALSDWRDGTTNDLAINPAAAVLPAAAPGLQALLPGRGIAGVARTRYGALECGGGETLVTNSVVWYGEWRQLQLDVLARIVHPGMTVVEVGAGMGAWSLFFSERLGDAGRLLLFEDSPAARLALQTNLAVNRCRNASLLAASPEDEGDDGRITLDDLQLARVSLVVCHDPDRSASVLAGGAETAWRLRPLLFLATEDATASVLALRVRDFGYTCWRCAAPLFNPDNFNRRKDDIFSTQTVAALLAIPEEANVNFPLTGLVAMD